MKKISIRAKVLSFLSFLLLTSSAYGELTESIKNTCPSDPSQGGKCSLVQQTSDGPSCQTIGGQQVCRDWWRQDFTYKCSGSGYDANTILGMVGTQYCKYTSTCSQWQDVQKSGGEASCRIYLDVQVPGCDSGTLNNNCVANDCGDMFQRCSFKQFVPYSDIPDPGNLTPVYYCDPGGNCGTVQTPGSSGTGLGIYTFDCPSETRQVCTQEQGTFQCPDGSTQVCNQVQQCTQYKDVATEILAEKDCLAPRTMQNYSYLKNSADANAARANSMCIKTGEAFRFVANQSVSFYGGWDSNGGDYSHSCFYGLPSATFCSELVRQIYTWAGCWNLISGETNLMNYINNTLYSDGSRVAVKINSVSQTGPFGCYGAACFGEGDNECMEIPITVDADMNEIYENFNCYQDSYQPCGFDGEAQCTKLSSDDINQLLCTAYDIDVDNPTKSQCKSYQVGYNCPTQSITHQCANYQTVLNCTNGVYPIPNVKVNSSDFGADFPQAMALAQATNEIKHLFGGEAYKCESGMWWLFDTESIWTYLENKMMSIAFQQLGAYIMDATGVKDAISSSMGCVGSVVNNVMSYYRAENVASGRMGPGNGNTSGSATQNAGDGSTISLSTSTKTNTATVTVSTPVYNADGSVADFTNTQYGIDTSKSQGCVAAMGQKLGQAVGLSPDQAGAITNFFSNTYVLAALGVLSDILTSLNECSTCIDQKCAQQYNEYKAYSLISNRLCHPVGNKCTSHMLFFGCTRTGYQYCCYDSLFARILTEQAYIELGYSWGSYDTPLCTNLTFDDLKRLDFDTMDFSEFIQYLQAKMHQNIDQNGLTQAIHNVIGNP